MQTIPQNEPAAIESDYHSLFVKELPEELIPLQSESGDIIEGLYQQVPAGFLYSLFLGEFGDETNHGLNKIIYALQTSAPGDLEIHITSPGGYTHEGMTLYNVINTLYKGRTTTYLNWGYSMGAIAFLFGDARVVYENSSLMIHNWSGGFYGKSRDIEDQLNHTKENLWSFFSKLISPYLSKKQMKSVEKGNELWFTSRELLENGMATHIIVDGELIEAKDYLKQYKKDGTLKKKYRKKAEEKSVEEYLMKEDIS